jgi:two-component system phosphate regulon sensor histidine kinase PhoR
LLFVGGAVCHLLDLHALGLTALAVASLWLVALLWRQQQLVASGQTQRDLAVGASGERDLLGGQLQAVLDAVTEAVLAVDQHGTVLSVNTACQPLIGLRQSDCRGRALADCLPWPLLSAALADCLLTGQARAFEGAFGTGAAHRTLAVVVTPWRAHGEIAGAVVVADDLSRLRRLESHRRDFVANVSHELKTPLAAIQGFVETLLDDAEVPIDTRVRFLQKIARQTERLATLVGDLLTLSRLDDERGVDANAEPCDLIEMARESLRDLHSLAERKGLQFHGDLPETPVSVNAEPELLRQVIGNLVDNAIKYTPEGGRVTVRVIASDGDAMLEVEDTGIGLSPEDQERVFERFYRVDKARSRELGGTGLGLAIVKNTVLNLGGRLGVRSQLNRGSIFWVSLPRAVRRHSESA